MVSSLNKWSAFISPLILSVSVLFMLPAREERMPKSLHPFHVSTTEINHNATDKTLEISCRIFIDDFEACLSKQYHTKADLTAASAKTAMDSLVKKYLGSHLQIKADGKTGEMKYLGFEKQEESAYVYLEIDNISSVKKLRSPTLSYMISMTIN